MATNFPDTSIINPDTGTAWADGDEFADANSGLVYYWYAPTWKTSFVPNKSSDARYVEVSGDTMTGPLILPGGGKGAQAIQVQEVETLIGDIDSTDFVSKTDTASQNIASDVTLGTDKITLDATNGMAPRLLAAVTLETRTCCNIWRYLLLWTKDDWWLALQTKVLL